MKEKVMNLRFLVSLSVIPPLMSIVCAQDITNPTQHFANAHNLTASDHLKKVEIDLNGDGIKDLLFAYERPNPDVAEQQAKLASGGILNWDAYIKDSGGNYSLSTGIEKNGTLSSGKGLPFRQEAVYVGQVSELSRHAFITVSVKNPKHESATVTVIAYTWEMDHFKQHELATFADGKQNATDDKYLAENKRTQLTVQDVTP